MAVLDLPQALALDASVGRLGGVTGSCCQLVLCLRLVLLHESVYSIPSTSSLGDKGGVIHDPPFGVLPCGSSVSNQMQLRLSRASSLATVIVSVRIQRSSVLIFSPHPAVRCSARLFL